MAIILSQNKVADGYDVYISTSYGKRTIHFDDKEKPADVIINSTIADIEAQEILEHSPEYIVTCEDGTVINV